MLFPKRAGRFVRLAVQRHPAAALLSAERVPHDRDGLHLHARDAQGTLESRGAFLIHAVFDSAASHRRLVVLVLGLDGDDAPGGVRHRGTRLVGGGERLVLLEDLLSRVEDDVEHFGQWRLHIRSVKPPAQDGELLRPPAPIAATQQAAVGRRNSQSPDFGAHEVGDEDVLRASVAQCRRVVAHPTGGQPLWSSTPLTLQKGA